MQVPGYAYANVPTATTTSPTIYVEHSLAHPFSEYV